MNDTQKFELGRVLATPGALEAIAASNQQPGVFVARHAAGDWGDVDASDGRLNDLALLDGSRVFSVYHTANGKKLYVITEATDDAGLRAATTALLAEEY